MEKIDEISSNFGRCWVLEGGFLEGGRGAVAVSQ